MNEVINTFFTFIMKSCILFFIIISCISLKVSAQDKSLYEKHLFVHKGDTMPYRVLLPQNFDPAKNYPLILFLHGSGERGRDNELQLVHCANFFLRDTIRAKYPAIVVFPQCSLNSFWSNVNIVSDIKNQHRIFNFQVNGKPTLAMKLLMRLVNFLESNYQIDPQRMYIAGLSMGGMGTFEFVRRKPKLFTAALAICGGSNPLIAKKLKHSAWWIFHGLKDNVVPPEFSRKMAEAILQQGAEVKLTLYPDATHNSWDAAFAEKDLMHWLFAHHRK